MYQGAIAAEVANELRAPTLLDYALIEGVGEHVREARADATVDGLAIGQGCRVRRRKLFPGLHGFRSARGTLYVEPQGDVGVERLVLLHELAHEVLRRSRVMHVHGDVWALTLAIAMPRAAAARAVTLADMSAIEGVPWWAAELRARWLVAAGEMVFIPPNGPRERNRYQGIDD